MKRHRALSSIALALTTILTVCVAAALGGCSNARNAMLDNLKEGNYFNQPFFTTPDWANSTRYKTVQLSTKGPVPAQDLVNAAGECPAKLAQSSPAPQPAVAKSQVTPGPSPAARRAQVDVGSIAGDLAGPPMPQDAQPKPQPLKRKPTQLADAGAGVDIGGLQPAGSGGAVGQPVMSGIALGMTECQAVRRAGRPNHVTITMGNKGQRKVVLSYLSGPWPGVYTFVSGRLKVVNAAPGELKPTTPKKHPYRRARTASKTNVYVQ